MNTTRSFSVYVYDFRYGILFLGMLTTTLGMASDSFWPLILMGQIGSIVAAFTLSVASDKLAAAQGGLFFSLATIFLFTSFKPLIVVAIVAAILFGAAKQLDQ